MSGYRGLARICARGSALGLFTAALLHAGTARAGDKEALAVFEFGVAEEWGLSGGTPSFGPSAAMEFTPLKDWLEIEVGTTRLVNRSQTQWETDLVLKKAFSLSPTVEIEPGIGPEWIHTISAGRTTNAIAAEAVVDFVLWPTPDRKFGWSVQPSYSYSFSKDHERSFGLTVSVLIAIP
jgi:hypothetical protein